MLYEYDRSIRWRRLVCYITEMSDTLSHEFMCLRDAELLEAAARNIRSKLGVSASATTGVGVRETK